MIELVYASIVREPSACAVLVTGAAGEPRFSDELAARLDRRADRPQILHGHAEPGTMERPLGLMADVLRRATGIDGLDAEAMIAAWGAWLSVACAARPVVLMLDGLHWADAATVSAVGEVLRRLAEQPLLVVAVGGAEVEARFPGLWEGISMLVVPIRAPAAA